MHDGRTRKLPNSQPVVGRPPFLDAYCVTLVVVEGRSSGTEFPIDSHKTIVGRGATDLSFDDPSMSREHAAFELCDDGMRVRDLGSTNGVHLNGAQVLSGELKHGDRIEIGEHAFQYLQEERSRPPRTYVLPDGGDDPPQNG